MFARPNLRLRRHGRQRGCVRRITIRRASCSPGRSFPSIDAFIHRDLVTTSCTSDVKQHHRKQPHAKHGACYDTIRYRYLGRVIVHVYGGGGGGGGCGCSRFHHAPTTGAVTVKAGFQSTREDMIGIIRRHTCMCVTASRLRIYSVVVRRDSIRCMRPCSCMCPGYASM